MAGEPCRFSGHGTAIFRGIPQPNQPTKGPPDKGLEHGATGPEAWLVAENPHFRNLRETSVEGVRAFRISTAPQHAFRDL